MRISVANKVYVEHATPAVFDWCVKNLEFPNPEYAKKREMGKWIGDTQPTIVLWEKRGQTAILPRGCLVQFVKDMGISAADIIFPEKDDYPPIYYKSNIELFDYQMEAVHHAFMRSGVLVMPCGSGKTQTALQMVAKSHEDTLVDSHSRIVEPVKGSCSCLF